MRRRALGRVAVVAAVAGLAAAPASAQPGETGPGFLPGANCFTGSYPAGSYPPADLREIRFALDLRETPRPGEAPGSTYGVIAARFGPPSLARREYFNAPVCWGAVAGDPLAVTGCGGEHDNEHFDLAWEGATLVLTTRGLTLDQGEMPDIRSLRLEAPPGTPYPPELDPDEAWRGPPVRFRLTRAPVSACAGIGPWAWEF